MKTVINRSIKIFTSFALAAALLFGSIFTANIGIDIKADAATGKTIYWSGTTPSTATFTGSGTKADPYIVDTAEKLAYLAKATVAATSGNYYKVADGIDNIILQPESVVDAETLMGLTSSEDVKTYLTGLSGVKEWPRGNSDSYAFAGSFDGNGVQIYGLYQSQGYCGLFPLISIPDLDPGMTFENFALRNSYMYSGWRLGSLIGRNINTTDNGSIYINNFALINCYLNTDTNTSNKGVIIGVNVKGFYHITNCLVYGNYTLQDGTNLPLANGAYNTITGSDGKTVFNTIENSIILDTPLHKGTASYYSNTKNSFENVYTDQSFTVSSTDTNYTYAETDVKAVTQDEIKGDNARTVMSALDFDTVWFAAEDSLPTLRVFHNITYTPYEEDIYSGHIEVCEDCGLVGTAVLSHSYNDENTCTLCGYVKNSADIKAFWDGTAADAFAGGSGTEADPFIIETAEQLYKMVVDGGKSDGNAAYYKVADGVELLYLSTATSGGYETVKTLASGTAGKSYYNWNTGTWTVFEGNFDGNGVTIKGMISKATSDSKVVGLVQVLGNNAVIKNVNFDNCYAYNSYINCSALIASKVIDYRDADADGTNDGGTKSGTSIIYNVSVRNSSIKSSSNTICAGLIAINNVQNFLQFVNCMYDGYSCELGDGTYTRNAGIFAYSYGPYNTELSGCVSLGAPLTTNVDSTTFNDYSTGTASTHPVYFYNCYTDVTETVESTVIALGEGSGENLVADADDQYITTMPLLDWANGWYVETTSDGRKIPMPRVRTADDITTTWDSGQVTLDYNRLLATADGGAGTSPYRGTYGHFDEFLGSGTEEDPYLISTPLELARAIGAGGKNVHEKLYFKLTCDIDLTGMAWLNTVGARPTNYTDTTSFINIYTYVPFEGTLDGDGHTITGLYAVNGNSDEAAYDADDDWKAGLIPELNGGTVKNLHIRNSYAGTGADGKTTGILVGKNNGGTITGCSVEDSIVAGGLLVGVDNNGSIENSYIGSTYYDAKGNAVTAADIDVASNSDVWYIGGGDDATPKLLSLALSMECADADGDGDGSEYNSNDLVALRQYLLRKSSYKNIYGDANHDGKVNTTDLVIIRRYMIDDYNKTTDGFWRNVQLGNIGIYYAENDTQDMARKLEIYFESVYGNDIAKYAGSAVTDSSISDQDKYTSLPTKNAVIITKNTPTDSTYDKYSVTFDSDKNLIKISGGSFTAVEQAVIDFIAESDPVTGIIATFSDRSILDVTTTEDSAQTSYKQKVTVDGTTYYYAWGDEFDGSGSFSTNSWVLDSSNNETSSGSTSKYMNLELAPLNQISQLYVVENGKLSIWRGVDTDYWNDSYSWGYKEIDLGTSGTKTDFSGVIEDDDKYVSAAKISTKNSMLFKQGYMEMKASLPSDGHAFPAWWFMNGISTTSNSTVTRSLYSKIYKLNSGYSGASTFVGDDITSYKYQLSNAFLEIDSMELMQDLYGVDGYGKNSWWANMTGSNNPERTLLTGIYDDYDVHFTIHKWYTATFNSAKDSLYLLDWDNNTTTLKFSSKSDFNPTSSTTNAWIHRYTSYSQTMSSLSNLVGTHIYGCSWTVDESAGTFSIAVYVDGTKYATITESTAYANGTVSTSTACETKNSVTSNDAAIANQYAYMILDNVFYTANPEYTGSSSSTTTTTTEFSDLLTQDTSSGTTDKTTFDIEYVRIYQQDGKRDIVTAETENFNTGNHFGY